MFLEKREGGAGGMGMSRPGAAGKSGGDETIEEVPF